MSIQLSNDSNQLPILFNDKRPDSLLLSQLYDPDIHGSNVEASGKIVPAVGSIVVDEADDCVAYAVVYVNEVFKSTLKPLRYKQNEADINISIKNAILNYGSSRFTLYYDDRVNPTNLMIDGKLYILGTSKVEYRLLRTNPTTGEDEIISLYLAADDKFKGNRIPLTNVINANGTVKICTDCHTLFPLIDGEIVTLQVFDANGRQTEEYNLIAKRSLIQDDLLSDGNPIVDFDADCTQMVGDEFYLYEKQSPTALNISPFVTYADGRKQIFAIDNISCFMYGFDRDNIPSYPGRRFKILIKKFLSPREITSIESFDKTKRSVSVEKWINIVKNETKYSLKLSIVPWYDSNNQRYYFKFFAYTDQRDHIYDVTNLITINEEFDPTNYQSEQYMRVEFDTNEIFQNGVTTIYQQSWWITLRAPNQYESYILKDSQNDSYAYGVESSTTRRPCIHYDKDLLQYFIPTSKFANKEAFLESFYTFAHPPYDTTDETSATVPTHFTIRAVDNANVLITTPIPVEEYHQLWNIVRTGAPNQLVGGVVLVEFLKLIGDEYRIIYGVPAQVYESSTGYNRPGNNITL